MKSDFTIVVIAGAFTLLAAYWAWWRIRTRSFLIRLAYDKTPKLRYLGVARSARDILFDGVSQRQTARLMRQRYEIETREVDSEQTINATLRQGGFPKYVYRRQLALPQYLALIDKYDDGDQHSRLIEEILRQLEASDVIVTRYYFTKDPRTCFAGRLYGLPETLTNLAQVHGGKRLLVFWDGGRLIDPVSGALEEWKEMFATWEHRFLFVPGEEWQSNNQKALLSQIFSVHSSSAAGLKSFAGIQGNQVSPTETQPGLIRELVSVASERWLSRSAPEQSSIDGLVAGLRDALGRKLFFWLCACAVYPELRFELTVFLGHNLRGESKDPLLDAERLGTLTSLPWFRRNYIPDWLRLRLIKELSGHELRSLRGSIGKLLLTALQKSNAEFELEVAEQEREPAADLFKAMLKRHLREGNKDSMLRDYVFIKAWAGWWNRLAFPLPPILQFVHAFRPRSLQDERRTSLESAVLAQILLTWSAIVCDIAVRWFGARPGPFLVAYIWGALVAFGLLILFYGYSIVMKSFAVASAVFPGWAFLHVVTGLRGPTSRVALLVTLAVTLWGFGILTWRQEADEVSGGRLRHSGLNAFDPFLGDLS